jgi:hypothetical protein
MNANLAREADVGCEFSLHGKAITLELTHFTGFACENFNPAGGAARVATAAMENVDPGILDYEH